MCDKKTYILKWKLGENIIAIDKFAMCICIIIKERKKLYLSLFIY